MRITKVKRLKEDRIRIEYETANSNGKNDEMIFTSSDTPDPSFYEAFSDLSEYVIEMCELDCHINKIKVTGVSFSYSGEPETMGAVITSQRDLQNSVSPLNLNTPYKILGTQGFSGDPRQLLSDKCAQALNKLSTESVLYVKGKRAQMQIFSDEANKEVS